MGQGWIKLHRKIRDCDLIWDDKPFSRGQAWIDLLLQANHEDKEILFNGTYRKIERGQTLTSLTKLSEKWGWSRKKTTKFLNELKMAQMLDLKSDNKSTAITIVNYSVYQEEGTAEEPQKNRKRTSEEHQRNTNKNDKRMNKNDKNNITTLSESEKTEYDFDKHTNLENTKHFLNSKEYDEWEYILANQDLYGCIKEWMTYKDEKKPRRDHHYTSETGIKRLLNEFVNSSKQYGIQNVIRVVEFSIMQNYRGVLWDKLYKEFPKNNIQTSSKTRYADALERMNRHMEEMREEYKDTDIGDFY